MRKQLNKLEFHRLTDKQTLSEGFKKNGLFSDIDQKGGLSILQKSLLLEALEIEIVTCH